MAAVYSLEPLEKQCMLSEKLAEPVVMEDIYDSESTFAQAGKNQDVVTYENSSNREGNTGDVGVSRQNEPLSHARAVDDVGTKDNLVVDLTSDDEKALINTDVSSNKPHFDWSESEDETEGVREHTKENGNYIKCVAVQNDDSEEVVESEDISNSEDQGREKSLSDEESSPMKGLCDDDDGGEEDEDRTAGTGEEKPGQRKKSRLICKECGKSFTRRETFNLHRHFHMHEDEHASLTCKECGLSFQHRSSLIKHRSEHRGKEEQAMNQQREVQLKYYQCERCRMTFSTPTKLREHVCNNVSEKPYRCPLCRKEFLFKCSITRHIQSHSLEFVFHCQECNKGFTDGLALRCHQRSHSALKPYECPDCGMVFKHYSVMEDHRRKHTQSTRPHQCPICSKTFKYGSLLHQHQYLHTGQKPFRCQDCGRTFAFAQNLKAHCRQHKRCPYACPICPLSFSDQGSLQAHVTNHSKGRGPGKENTNQEPKRVINCPLCPETYSKPADLRTHMLIHEAEYERLENGTSKTWENTYTCNHCPLTFSDHYSLQTHLSTHAPPSISAGSMQRELEVRRVVPPNAGIMSGRWRGEDMSNKPLKCPDCGKAFRHRSVLQLHMRIHSKDKPYQCKVCHKSFRFNNYLQQHLIIHTGEKPFKCPDCGKDFAFLQNMKTHQKLHLQKPFRCNQCRKGYSDESQLQRHILSHTGDKPHKCHLCDKSFGIAYLLRDHMNTHTGERPHRCQDCHKSFPWLSSLLVHQKIHARKHQGQSQPHSFPMGVRIRSRGSRGRRGGRLSWPRLMGGSSMIMHQDFPQQVAPSRDTEWERRPVKPQSPKIPSQVDLLGHQQQEQWMSQDQPPPVQWQVEGGQLKPISMPQHHKSAQQQPPQRQAVSPSRTTTQQRRSPGWPVTPSSSQPGLPQGLEPRRARDSVTTEFVNKPFSASVPKYPSFSDTSESERQRQPQVMSWCNMSTSLPLTPSSSSQHNFQVHPSFLEATAHWAVRTPSAVPTSQSSPRKLSEEPQLSRWSGVLVSTQNSASEVSIPPNRIDTRVWNLNAPQALPQTVKQSEIPWSVQEQHKHWSPSLASVSSSAQLGQNTILANSSPSSQRIGDISLNLKETLGISKTSNSPEKSSINQEMQSQSKQLPFSWTNVPTATHKVPIPYQYETNRFPHGVGSTFWGFQASPVGPQTLLTGPIKPGNGQELQQQSMLTGTQIIINQSSPFLSPPLAPFPPFVLPGPHPLHSVAVSSLPRPPNIFFSPQGVISERPHMPQALQLPQLASRTETHKLGGRLPFAPDRLLQCMICGCSLPSELDLQMHYLQHAQGEI